MFIQLLVKNKDSSRCRLSIMTVAMILSCHHDYRLYFSDGKLRYSSLSSYERWQIQLGCFSLDLFSQILITFVKWPPNNNSILKSWSYISFIWIKDCLEIQINEWVQGVSSLCLLQKMRGYETWADTCIVIRSIMKKLKKSNFNILQCK